MQKSLNEILKAETDRIATILLKQPNDSLKIGLYDGLTGISLYMYLQYKQTKKLQYKNKLDSLIKQSLTLIENNKQESIFSIGLAGWGWFITFLESQSYIEESEDTLKSIDELLMLDLMRFIRNGEYDLLNGALGIGLYFIKRGNRKAIEIILTFFESHLNNNVLTIKRKMHKTNEDVFDFGLAHGYAGIAYFFTKCIKEEYYARRSKRVLNATINFIMKNIDDQQKHNSYLPHIKWDNKLERQQTRLAWCYGDLGAFYTLYNTGVLLNDQPLITLSVNALINSSTKRDNKECMIFDSGFCHGSSGATYLFYKMYHKTNKLEYRIASNVWLKATLLFANANSMELDRYMFFNPNIDGTNKYENSYALLDGITGVGLVYLSILYPGLPIWDECLMLS